MAKIKQKKNRKEPVEKPNKREKIKEPIILGKAPFAEYRKRLNPEEDAELSLFVTELGQRIMLSKRENDAIAEDFEKAFLYYDSVGVGFGEASARLAVQNLGGFYVRPAIRWYALDTAAKVYPLSMRHDQMAIFRLSAYLKEDVVPELLQMALTFTVRRFPSFATKVKEGFFWHYLNASKTRYCVQPETDIPCRPIKITESGNRSFRVLYFRNRISVEYFHILTDGTGGMEFLKVLLAEYLRLCGVVIGASDYLLDISATPDEAETENAFPDAEKADKASGFMDKPAVQLSGKLSYNRPCRIIHFKMDAAKLNAVAKSKGATMTVYLLSLMFAAGKYSTDEPEGIMNIQVPFNMRKYHPTKTIRNFSLYCGIKFPIEEISSADSLIEPITKQLTEKTSRDAMREMLTSSLRMVNRVKFVPLFIKAPFIKIGYGFLGDTIFSNTLSNLGIVKLPDEMAEHIESMDFVLGTVITNRASCALVTVNNVATFSISKLTGDPSFEEKMYELLTADGIDVKAEGSMLYED